jgi:hypothetical protein
MGLLGRYFSDRDMRLINSINRELLDEVIQTQVIIFKACADATPVNIYGESDTKTTKKFYPGLAISCFIDRGEISTEPDDFGPNRKQNVVFKFREFNLKEANLFPQTGDIIQFNERYHEIDDVAQEQFLGGIPDKSFSIICNTHYSRLSKVEIVERQS